MTDAGIQRFRQGFRRHFEGDPRAQKIYAEVSAGKVPAGAEFFFPLFFEHTCTLFDYLKSDAIWHLPEGLDAIAKAHWAEICDRHQNAGYDRERQVLPPEMLYVRADLCAAELRKNRRIIHYHGRGSRQHEMWSAASEAGGQFPVEAREASPYQRLVERLRRTENPRARTRVLLAVETAGRREAMEGVLANHDLAAATCDGFGAFVGGYGYGNTGNIDIGGNTGNIDIGGNHDRNNDNDNGNRDRDIGGNTGNHGDRNNDTDGYGNTDSDGGDGYGNTGNIDIGGGDGYTGNIDIGGNTGNIDTDGYGYTSTDTDDTDVTGNTGDNGNPYPDADDGNSNTGNNPPNLAICVYPLERGLHLPPTADAAGIEVIAESQLYGERALQRRRSARAQDPEAVIKSLAELHEGDPVVHLEHGVGRYCGLQFLQIDGRENEFLTLEYQHGDKLYVPVLSLNLIGRFVGGAPEHAPLHRLGGEQWAKARKRAREKAYDVAAELLEMQALTQRPRRSRIRRPADRIRRLRRPLRL